MFDFETEVEIEESIVLSVSPRDIENFVKSKLKEKFKETKIILTQIEWVRMLDEDVKFEFEIL